MERVKSKINGKRMKRKLEKKTEKKKHIDREQICKCNQILYKCIKIAIV